MTPAELAERAAAEVLGDLDDAANRAVVVDSPPGAGKSTLVVRAAAALAAREPVMVVAQTNEQVDDLACRLATSIPGIRIGRLSAHGYRPTPRLTRHASVPVSSQLDDLAGCPVIIATAAKWARITGDARWTWAVVDEAYQMRSDTLLRIAGRFERALLVGDPGQLDPFSTVETTRWTGLTWDPMQNAVTVLLRHNSSVPVRQLPVSWRLTEPAAAVVADAFYPFGGFQAGTRPGERRLELTARAFGASPLDQAVDTAAATGWALYELPARHTPRTDAQATLACAMLAVRILQRGAVSCSEQAPDGTPVTAARIAIGTAHRDQVRAIRACLGANLDEVTVDTANRLQGREFDVVIVLHPLSGRRDATAFHLEAGRLCVLTSRHRHACIVVTRAGVPELLDAHPSTEPAYPNVPAKFPDGWEANQSVMAHLSQYRVGAL